MFSFTQQPAQQQPAQQAETNQPIIQAPPVEQILTIDIFYEDIKKWLNSRRIIPQNALPAYKELKSSTLKQFFEQEIFNSSKNEKNQDDKNMKSLETEVLSFFTAFESKLLETEDSLPTDFSKTYSEAHHFHYVFLSDLLKHMRSLQKTSESIKNSKQAQKQLNSQIEALKSIVEEKYESQKLLFIELPTELTKIVKYEIPGIRTSIVQHNKKIEDLEKTELDIKKQITSLEKQWDSILIKELGFEQSNVQNEFQSLKIGDLEVNNSNSQQMKDFLSAKIRSLTAKLNGFWENWMKILTKTSKNELMIEKSLDFYVDFMVSLQFFEEMKRKQENDQSQAPEFFKNRRNDEKQNSFRTLTYLIKVLKENDASNLKFEDPQLSVLESKLYFKEIDLLEASRSKNPAKYEEIRSKIEEIAQKDKKSSSNPTQSAPHNMEIDFEGFEIEQSGSLDISKAEEIEIVADNETDDLNHKKIQEFSKFRNQFLFENDEIRKNFLLEFEELSSFFKSLSNTETKQKPFQDLDKNIQNDLKIKNLSSTEIEEAMNSLILPFGSVSISNPLFQNLLKIKCNKGFVDSKVDMLLQFKKTKERLEFEIKGRLENEKSKILVQISKKNKKKEYLKQRVERIVSELEEKIKREKMLTAKNINIYGMDLD